jgi:hypothetical protein
MPQAEDDQLLAAALAAKALTTAQQALAAAQAAGERALPVPVDVQALLAGFVDAMSRLILPTPAVTVEAAAAQPVNFTAPDVTVNVASPPPAEVNVSPVFEVTVPEAPPPVVNVAAPVVNFEPPPVNVPAAVVRIVEVATPRAPWRMTVSRDPRTNLILSADIEPVEAAA